MKILSLNRGPALIKTLAAVAIIAYLPSAMADLNGVMGQFQSSGQAINAKLIKPALQTATAALCLQWILTYWKEVFSGDISSSLAKSVGLITWYSATVMLINHFDLMSNAFAAYVKLAGNLSSLTPEQFTPGGMIDFAKTVITAVHSAVSDKTGNDFWAVSKNIGASLSMIVVDVILLLSFFVVGLSLFVCQLEFWMMFAVAPLAFGLIPLSAFREQGIAPVKGVISMGLRILILGVVVAVAKSLADTAATSIPAAINSSGEGFPLIGALADYLAGSLGCAMMAASSGKLASSIASGSASFSGGDAIRTGMQIATTGGAAGAAAGLAASTGANAAGALARPAISGIGNKAASLFSGGPATNTGATSGSGGLGAPLGGQSPMGMGGSGGTGSDGSSLGATNPGSSGSGSSGSGSSGSGSSSSETNASGNANSGNASTGSQPAGINGQGSADKAKSSRGRLGGPTMPADDHHAVSVQINLRGAE